MKVSIFVNCEGPSFTDAYGQLDPEQGMIDVLEDLTDMIRSGTHLADLHMHKLKCSSGQEVGVVLVSEPA